MSCPSRATSPKMFVDFVRRSSALTVAAGVLAVVAPSGPRNVQADAPKAGSGDQAGAQDNGWGPESRGLRCRLVAVSASTDPELPDVTKTTGTFAHGNDVTFAVELKNVGEKPVTLLGVRYGESLGKAAGKLATETFAPHLFEFEFNDAAGRPIPRPSRVLLDRMLELSGASAHELAPGKSLVVLLRPAQFDSPMETRLPAGDYKARVRYHGPSEADLAQMRKFWPDKPQGRAWSGEVASNQVAFTVAKEPKPKPQPPPVLHWGKANAGLRAEVTLRDKREARPPSDPPDTIPLDSKLDVVLHLLADPPITIPLNSRLGVILHLENVGDTPLSVVSERWRQNDNVVVKNAAGKEQELGGSWYSGVSPIVRWTLRPGEVVEIECADFVVATNEAEAEKFDDPVGHILIAKPGRYSFRYTVRLPSFERRDSKGNVVVPAKGDWQGELVTGETPLIVRARTPEDDAAERAGRFVGRIEFVGKDGKPIRSGSFTAPTDGRDDPAAIQIHAGPIEIPDCRPARPLMVDVRAPGYEEALFDDVQLKPGETRRLELTPAAPTRFRLVSSVDGKPVAGAKVRLFAKTSENAGFWPDPNAGIRGPIWATSQADGTVILDTLQKINPYAAELGDAVYYFYVEAPGLAGQFLVRVKAGKDLGDIKLSGPLEVRGEIRGTPEELERFEAEWDQPLDLQLAADTLYAVSEELVTKREGNKLTFHLTGLRPGKLRVIGSVGPQPHAIVHTFAQRVPKETNFVVEVDLKESITDFVITPADRKPAQGKGK